MDRTRVMVMGTGSATRNFIIKNQDSKYIVIIGIILDQAISDEDRRIFISELNDSLNNNIEEYVLTSENLAKADIVFMPEYRKILSDDLTEKFCIINCHGGILPKWRGFSANAWAIMNGENEIGFTIHRARPTLDDGEIYYVKHIPIEKCQTYSDVHDEMLELIATDAPKILYDIFNGNNVGYIQPNTGFAYCNKFNRSMGDISGFEFDSKYYVNLWRCMEKPLGTGLWFNYKGLKFEVAKVEHGSDFGVIDYFGIPGKVVNIKDNRLWIKTNDNVVVLSHITLDSKEISVSEFFRNGSAIIKQ